MIKILILILISYFLIINSGIYSKIKNKNLKPNKFKQTDKKIIKKLAEGMKLTHDIFSKNNIFYQICYGSLLGSVRHEKIIPWDDDADLHIYLKDVNKIMALKSEFNKYGWTLEKDWKLLKIKQLDKFGNVLEQAFIDLFIIDVDDKNMVRRCLSKEITFCNQMPSNHVWWHKWYNFPLDLIKGKKLFRFVDKEIGYDFMMYGPKNAKKILKFWYGSDCLDVCQSPIYDHNTSKYIKSIKIPCNKISQYFNI